MQILKRCLQAYIVVDRAISNYFCCKTSYWLLLLDSITCNMNILITSYSDNDGGVLYGYCTCSPMILPLFNPSPRLWSFTCLTIINLHAFFKHQNEDYGHACVCVSYSHGLHVAKCDVSGGVMSPTRCSRGETSQDHLPCHSLVTYSPLFSK